MIEKLGEPVLVRKQYDSVMVVSHPHGDEEEEQFRLKRDENYNSIYVKLPDKMNIREYVNSFRTGCSLKSILDRCNLMPVHDKINYVNQTPDGFSADLSAMPKDGFEANMMLLKLKSDYPEIVQRLSQGESFDAILNSFGPFSNPGVSQNQTKDQSEVNANG